MTFEYGLATGLGLKKVRLVDTANISKADWETSLPIDKDVPLNVYSSREEDRVVKAIFHRVLMELRTLLDESRT